MNLLSGLVFLGASVLVSLGSIETSVGSFRSPGPGLYPLILASGLGILSLLLCLVGLSDRRVGRERLRALLSPHTRQVGFIIGILFAYTALLPLAGFSVGSFLMLGTMFKIGEVQRGWSVAALLAVAFTLSAEVLAFVLEIPLPGAILRNLLSP